MNVTRIILGLFVFSTCFAFLVGYINLPISAFIRRLGVSELLFVLCLTFTSVLAQKAPLLNFKTHWLTKFLWGMAIIALLAPHIIKPPHFFGNDYRLFGSLCMLWLFVPFTRMLDMYDVRLSQGFITCLVYIAFLYSLSFILLYPTGVYVRPSDTNTNYLFPGFYNIRHMGYVFAPLLTLCIVYSANVFQQGRSIQTWICIIGLPITWSILLWSGSRAGMLSVIISFALTIVLSKFSRRKIAYTFIWSLLLGIALESVYPYTSNELGFLESLFVNQNLTNANSISSGRIEIWGIAIENIRQSPVLGYGVEGFREYAKIHGNLSIAQIHNATLEILHSGGIFAAIGMIFPVSFFYFKLCWHIRKTHDWILLAAFTTITVTLISSFLNGVLFHYRPLMHTVILFAIANYHLNLLDNEKPIS